MTIIDKYISSDDIGELQIQIRMGVMQDQAKTYSTTMVGKIVTEQEYNHITTDIGMFFMTTIPKQKILCDDTRYDLKGKFVDTTN